MKSTTENSNEDFEPSLANKYMEKVATWGALPVYAGNQDQSAEYLSENQLNALTGKFQEYNDQTKGEMARIRGKYFLIFLFLKYTGARISEVLAIDDQQDVDFRSGDVRLITLKRHNEKKKGARRIVPVPLQVVRFDNYRTENNWQAGQTNHPYVIGSGTSEFNTSPIIYQYNDKNFISKVSRTWPNLDINYTYDAVGNVTQEQKVTSDSTLLTKYTYNATNDLIRIDYPDGRNSQTSYDSMGMLSGVTNNDGTTKAIERNGRGEVTAVVDEQSRRVELTRDIMGRVVKEKSPSAREINYIYGGTGCSSCGDTTKLIGIIDAGGKTWNFKYDNENHATEMDYPDGSAVKQAYDLSGRLVSFSNRRNQEIDYQYDLDGNLVKKITPEGITDFNFDSQGRITEIIAPNYHYFYQYGFVGGVGTVWQQNEVNSSTMLQMTFDQSYGMPVDVFDGFGWRKKYYYSGNTGLGFFPKNITYYRQDNGGSSMQTYLTYDNGMRLTYKENNVFDKREYFNYNTNGVMNQSSYLASSGYQNIYTATGQLNFGRDSSGIINTITGDKQLSATYDADLDITGVQHTLPQPISEAYTYDSRGNRLTSAANSFIYDDQNRLLSSLTNSYTYDADGNMTQERNIVTGETKKYYYDSENRLVRYEHIPNDVTPMDVVALYTYDLFGRRLQKNVNGAITNFHWEGETVGLELDSNYQPIRKYITGEGMDEYEGHLEYSEMTDWSHVFDNISHQAWYSYMRDQVGTIYQAYNHHNHAIAETRAYDTFGNNISQTGISKTNFGFQGKYYDIETGLDYFYQRFYSPQFGKFTTEDPVKINVGLNLYEFEINNPIYFVDPIGTKVDNTDHHRIRPGTENRSYNCMAYALGASHNIPKSDIDPGRENPNLLPPRSNCIIADCGAECNCKYYKIKIFQDSDNPYGWHVYRQDNGAWSCKYGKGPIGDITDPDPEKDYRDVYHPTGNVTITCFCCPIK